MRLLSRLKPDAFYQKKGRKENRKKRSYWCFLANSKLNFNVIIYIPFFLELFFFLYHSKWFAAFGKFVMKKSSVGGHIYDLKLFSFNKCSFPVGNKSARKQTRRASVGKTRCKTGTKADESHKQNSGEARRSPISVFHLHEYRVGAQRGRTLELRH